jgi:hypothetical protein
LIAVNDDYRHRVVLISMRTKRIVWQYGHTDVAGRRPGYLNTPDGLDLLRTAAAQGRPAVRSLLSAKRASVHIAVAPRSGRPTIHVRSAGYRLPAPVQREVAVAAGGRVLIAGGLDTTGRSTSGVFRLDPSSGRLARLGSMRQAFHDAAGALLGHRLFVFGGGAAQSSATVQQFDLRTRRSAIVSRLPRALSDLSSATVGDAVYLVGGYDGRIPRREIYRTTDGRHFVLAGRLPVGLRYAAVTAVGASLVVAGGISSSGASSSVYEFDPAAGRSHLLGRLPGAVGHASAVTLGGTVYVIGGADANGNTTGSVTAIDVGNRTIRPVAAAAHVSDAAAVVLGVRALIIGGAANGRAVATVREVR